MQDFSVKTVYKVSDVRVLTLVYTPITNSPVRAEDVSITQSCFQTA